MTREHYWVSFFAMTIAQALQSDDPKKTLRPALQRFMRESGANHVRAQLVGVMQREGSANGRS
jgi:hypothetical protein